MVVGSGIFTVGTISVLSCLPTRLLVWTLVPLGFLLAVSGASAPIRRLWTRLPGSPAEGGIVLFGGALLFFGVAIGGASTVVPAVDGTVAGHRRGKGVSYVLVVTRGEHTYEVIGNAGFAPCPVGEHLSKSAWSTAYRCGAVQVPVSNIPTYVVLALMTLMCWLLVVIGGFAFFDRARR